MAPKNTYIRFWCSKCQEFTLHNITGEKDCRECGTITETYNIKDVPKEKVLEQRARYKAAEKKKFEDTFSYLLNPQLNILQEMMLEDAGLYNPYEPEIIETDAGQKAIDELEKQRRHAESLKRQEEQVITIKI